MQLYKVFAAIAPVAGLLAVPAMPSVAFAQEGGKCTVTLDRTYSADTYYVTRQEAEKGGCVCYIQTGPDTQSAAVEGKIAALQEAKECGNADNVMAIPAGYQASSSGVGSFSLIPAIAAVGVAAAGVAVALDNDDGGPASP